MKRAAAPRPSLTRLEKTPEGLHSANQVIGQLLANMGMNIGQLLANTAFGGDGSRPRTPVLGVREFQ
jgi:hypothetical protein